MNKKRAGLYLCFLFIIILFISFVSAGLFSRITGKADVTPTTSTATTTPKIVVQATIEADGWTNWLNRDTPGGSGDWEIKSGFLGVCASPTAVECRRIGTTNVFSSAAQALQVTGQTLTVSPSSGCVCESTKNPTGCYDYEVRFKCESTPAPTCGDGVCNSAETCSNCPSDCENCSYSCFQGNYKVLTERVCSNDKCENIYHICAAGEICIGFSISSGKSAACMAPLTSTVSCIDNDTGFYPYKYGVMTRSNVQFTYTDMCDRTNLMEWVCDPWTTLGSLQQDPNVVQIREYYPSGGYWAEFKCPLGCKDGTCITTSTCTDNDNGNFPLSVSNCTDSTGIYLDTCYNGTAIYEKVCSNNACINYSNKYQHCPTGYSCVSLASLSGASCIVNPSCRDSDAFLGLKESYYIKGNITSLWSPNVFRFDQCANDSILGELICVGGDDIYISYNCSSEGKFCKDGACINPTCTDRIKNGVETGVDCGGSCPVDCPPITCSSCIAVPGYVWCDFIGLTDICATTPPYCTAPGNVITSNSGTCPSICVPNCAGRVCGSDGCGGSCGTCQEGYVCSSSGFCENKAITQKSYCETEKYTADSAECVLYEGESLILEEKYSLSIKYIDSNKVILVFNGESLDSLSELETYIIHNYDIGHYLKLSIISIDYASQEGYESKVHLSLKVLEEEPIIVPGSEDCVNGCYYASQNKCIPYGFRLTYEGNKVYCDLDNELDIQKSNTAGGAMEACNNNFECESNVCVDGGCVSSSLIQKILEWFRNLFGGS